MGKFLPVALLLLMALPSCSRKPPPVAAVPAPAPAPAFPAKKPDPAPLPGPGGEKIEALVEKWRSAELEDRDRATYLVVARWEEWTEPDLATLLRAIDDGDSEVVERAREAMARIRVRKDVGSKLAHRLKDLDVAFTRGSDEDKLTVLSKAIELYDRHEIDADDLHALETVASRAAWTHDSSLAFLNRSSMGRLIQLPADRHRMKARAVERIASEGKSRGAELVPYLKDPDGEVRSTAFRMLDELNAREQAPKLVPLLKETNVSIRSEALSLLEGWGRKEFAPEFAPLLKDPHWKVRGKAAEALGAWGLKEYALEIASLLKDPYGQTRSEAAWALGEFGAKEFAAEIAALLLDPSPAARRNAAFALGRLGARDQVPRLLRLLEDKDPWVRIGAVQALGMLGRGEHLRSIVPLLRQMDAEVRSDAVWVLGRLASRELRKEIVQLLEDRDSEVRHDAISILERLDAREQQAEIAAMLKDSSGWVRAQAAVTLGRLGADAFADDVARLLKDADRRARVWAAIGLGELASRSGEARVRVDAARRLSAVEGDDDRVVGLSASVGLIRLGQKDRAAQRQILREFAENSVARPYLARVLFDALAKTNDPEGYERLQRRVDVSRPVETWSDLAEIVRSSGLRLEAPGEAFPIVRMEPGTAGSVRGVLEWVLGRYAPPEIVLEDRTVLLMSAAEAFGHWRTKLEGK